MRGGGRERERISAEGKGERNLAGGIIGSWNGGEGRPRQLLEEGMGGRDLIGAF